jgi:hypothetical protein
MGHEIVPVHLRACMGLICTFHLHVLCQLSARERPLSPSFLRRCTHAQDVAVTWRDGHDVVDNHQGCHVKFQGQGSTTEERRSSMQRQLAALCSCTQFLAPSSWPACNVLTCCRLSAEFIDPHLYMEAASHTTSLVSLDVCGEDVSSFTSLHLGSLSNLTQLELSTQEVGEEAPCTSVLEAIGRLSKLQQLRLDDSLFGHTEHDVGASIPASWSGLQSLQQLEMWYGRVELPSLFHLTGLTSLEGTALSEAEHLPPRRSGSTAVPRQWRDGLRHLSWGSCGRSSLPFLSQLTSLTSLDLKEVCVSPELCR